MCNAYTFFVVVNLMISLLLYATIILCYHFYLPSDKLRFISGFCTNVDSLGPFIPIHTRQIVVSTTRIISIYNRVFVAHFQNEWNTNTAKNHKSCLRFLHSKYNGTDGTQCALCTPHSQCRNSLFSEKFCIIISLNLKIIMFAKIRIQIHHLWFIK